MFDGMALQPVPPVRVPSPNFQPQTYNSFALNLFADPHPLNPALSIFYKKGGGRVLLFQISTSSNSPNSPEDSYRQKLAAPEDCLVILEAKREPRTVTKLRISIVQYLNTAPLVWGFTNGPLSGKYDLSFTVPSQCADDLRSSRADVAIIPAIEYQRIDNLVILPDMAIASKKQVRSLLIISKKPIEQVKSFALDASSRSTQALTRILCAEKWKITPKFFEAPPNLNAMLEQADAGLLIGDPALRISVGIEKDSWQGAEGQTVCPAAILGIIGSELLYVYDVVGEWKSLTGLPAVLAVWTARREIATPELTVDFLASRDFGLSRIPEICLDAARGLELPQRTLEEYLGRNIDFSLDEENRRGLESYFTSAAKLGLIPQAKQLEYAAAKAEAVKL
jgi:chorismate dehydratase